MGSFFAELKRRHIYRVAAAYAVVAWLLLQLFNNITPILKLPDWAGLFVLILLIGGFPIALLFAWIHQVADKDAVPRPATTPLDYVLTAALIVVISLISYQQFAPQPETRVAAAAPTLPDAQGQGISLAVLPFANVSGDPAQEFISDGMTDEIMTALAKVPSLRVVGRESAFQFKNQKTDNRAMGQALGARYLIEGSVRKAGERVRITAQLVQAGDGVSLWTDSYDRELKDIFAVQEDVARAIAASLRAPLGLAQGETLVQDRTSDLDSYQQYLRARTLYRSRGDSVPQAISILQSLVARNPNYAPAWGLLARAYLLLPEQEYGVRNGSLEESRRAIQINVDKADTAARRSMQLEPKIGSAYGAIANIEVRRGRLVEAEDFYKRSLAADPGNPDELHGYSQFLDGVGRLKESLSMREKLRQLEPFVPVFNGVTAAILQQTGQYQAASAIWETLPQGFEGFVSQFLAQAQAASGRYAEASDTLRHVNSSSPRAVEDAARLLGMAPTRVAEPLPDLEELNFVYAYVGAVEHVLDFPERSLAMGARVGLFVANSRWSVYSAPARKTERFKIYARKAGLVDYWKARGWPDLCRPLGADDFECD